MPAGSRLSTCTTTEACPAARWSGLPSVNNKDRNFTLNLLQDFIRAADERLDDYLRRLDEGDIEEGGTGGGARTKNLPRRLRPGPDQRAL
jgi:hypothetical protein